MKQIKQFFNRFVHPPIPKPFMHIYSHDDWVFDPEIVHFPKLLIRATDHRMGKRPRLEFMQGDYVFPWESDSNGNITIIRNNHSIGRFADLGVVIRRNQLHNYESKYNITNRHS